MLIKLIEVYATDAFARGKFDNLSSETLSLREVYLNSEHVVCLREDLAIREKVKNSNLSGELDERQEYTKVIIDRGQSGIDLTVVGDISLVRAKLNNGEKKECP